MKHQKASRATTPRAVYDLDRFETEAIEELSAKANQLNNDAQSFAEQSRAASAAANALAERAQGIIHVAARRFGIDTSTGDWMYEKGRLQRKGA